MHAGQYPDQVQSSSLGNAATQSILARSTGCENAGAIATATAVASHQMRNNERQGKALSTSTKSSSVYRFQHKRLVAKTSHLFSQMSNWLDGRSFAPSTGTQSDAPPLSQVGQRQAPARSKRAQPVEAVQQSARASKRVQKARDYRALNSGDCSDTS